MYTTKTCRRRSYAFQGERGDGAARSSRRGRGLCDPRLLLRRATIIVVAVLITAAILYHPAHAQSTQRPALNPELHLTQYVHDAWTTEQGLPQNAVYAVLQASDGYVWLGTQDGLVRFDGDRFDVYTKASGLESTEIRALLEDASGSIWIGTNGGGVSRLRDGKITTYRTNDGLPSDLVRSLFEDDQGNVWVGMIDGGVSRFDGDSFTSYTPADGLAGNVVLSIEEHGGSLWFGTEAGLSRFADGTFTNYTTADGLPHELVWSLESDASGSLWIGTTTGLARLRGEDIAIVSGYNCGEVVSTLHSDPRGVLWLGTLSGGLCRLHDDRFETFSHEDGLSNDRVRAISSDTEGNLWIGTERGGLNRLKQGKFTHLTRTEGLSGDVVFSVMEDRDGTLWIGTEGAGLNRIEEGRITRLSTEHGLPSDQVYALDEDGRGAIWIGMYQGGVCRLHDERLACYGAKEGLENQDVYAVLADRRGRVWVGTNAGLYIRDGEQFGQDGERFAAYRAGDSSVDAPVTAILEDAGGDVWVGTYGEGLQRLDADGIQKFGPEDGLSSEIVLTLIEDSRGTIWAGTQGGGLCRIFDERIACITSTEGLHNDNVLQILEAGDDAFWLGTLQGIVRVERDALFAVMEGRGERLAQTIFGATDGLKTTETSGGTQPAAWRSSDGRLWFATNRGVATIDPKSVRTNDVAPKVYVESIRIEDETLPATDGIRLPAGSRDVTFRYTGLSYTAPEAVRFRYKLEGYDDGWIEAGHRREAFYTNLAPGSYRFVVTAANADGVWNENGASVHFHLEPFFYQTWWFTWLCILAAAAAALSGYRLRIRRLKQRERELESMVAERTYDLRREKERTEESKRVIERQADELRELDRFKTKFFANVSHEFRTPLTMIVGPLENMLAGLYEPLSGTMQQQVEVMLRNALRLMRLINQLLDLSKLEDGKMKLRARERDLVSFLDGVVLSCSSFAERKQIDLRFEADAEEIVMAFEPDKFEKVFYNLLSNATKFTPQGGRISVAVAQLGPATDQPHGAVSVTVTDTGRGIPEDQLPYVFERFHQVDGPSGWDHEGTGIGLALVKEMVLLHGGTIDVESEEGEGASFRITLPKGTAHLSPDQLAPADLEDDIVEHGGAMAQLATSDFNFMHADEEAPQLSGRAAAGEDAPLVLVVDDNKDVREYVAGILSDEYRIAMACDGAEGLDRAREVKPDLILSDVMMPNMDGNAFCRAVKTSPELNHTPVILLTARATHQLKIEGLEVGADDHIPKPFNVQELKVRIKNLLRLRRQERELKALNDHLEARVQEQVDAMLEQRRRYEEDLIDAKERAEASDRLKSNILNNLSHEFRTPLTAILGFSEIIRAEAPEGIREFTYEIERGGRRLLRTLDALLELSRIEAQQPREEVERIDANAFVGGIVGRFDSQAKVKELMLRFQPSDDDVEIELNPYALRLVLQNLIENAVKFTTDGEVEVSVEAFTDDVLVRVRDTGIGMSEEFLPRMFDAFVQESDGHTREFEGCGLGLTIARRLIELIDGSIQVETTKGEGTVFTVAIPAHAAMEA